MQLQTKWYRYFYAILIVIAMVGVAEWTGEKEIIFPEMAALTIGMWIVDKRVWRVNRLQVVLLMTAGAITGILITRYSPFPLLLNLALAFLFTGCSLLFSRTTLIPLISACMLPVLLHTESWIYPSAVFLMSLLISIGQYLMEKTSLRQPVTYTPVNRSRKKESIRWLLLLSTLLIIACIPVYTSAFYCILPPLVVTYVEFANSKAGFRNRPVHTYLLLVIAAILGTVFQLIAYRYLHLPESVIAFLILICLFSLYEWSGKYFAPAAAMALIPLIVPQENLIWLPLQVAIGAALFITTAMLLFLKCYKWPKAYLIVCMIPASFRPKRRKKISPSKKSIVK